MAFNKVILVGNMVADPELKQTPSGVSVATFRIAVQRRYAKADDAVQADFINIVAWRNTAEFVNRYFAKGSQILVCGALQSRDYTDANGQRRYITEVVAEEVSFVGKKSDNARADSGVYYGAEPQGFGATKPAQQPETNFEEVGGEDDLPF